MIPGRRANQTWLALGAVIAWVTAAAVMGNTFGRGSFFLTMAGGVLLVTIWLFWQSAQNLTGEAPLTLEEALGLGAPSAEEERKESVLRMLKDLEYERAVGKIADEDFKELSKKYRAEAKALLLTLDESMAPARERAESALKERLAREGAQKTENDSKEGSDAPSDAEAVSAEAVESKPPDDTDAASKPAASKPPDDTDAASKPAASKPPDDTDAESKPAASKPLDDTGAESAKEGKA